MFKVRATVSVVLGIGLALGALYGQYVLIVVLMGGSHIFVAAAFGAIAMFLLPPLGVAVPWIWQRIAATGQIAVPLDPELLRSWFKFGPIGAITLTMLVLGLSLAMSGIVGWGLAALVPGVVGPVIAGVWCRRILYKSWSPPSDTREIID